MTAITSAQVLDSIERSFDPKRGYLVIREIALTRGDGRRADAVALQQYAARGIHLHGFEVKISRSDWTRELRDAAKADELIRSCEYFSVVAVPGVVRPEELPPGWGLFEVRGATRQLHRVVAATRRPDAEPLSLASACRLTRRAIEAIRAPGEEALRAAEERGHERGVAAGRREGDRVRPEADIKLRAAVRAFEEASGVEIPTYHERRAGRIGAAVRVVLESGENLEYLRDDVARTIAELQRLAASLPEAPLAGRSRP